MSTQLVLEDVAPEIDPLIALAAMLDVQRSLIEAAKKMVTLTQRIIRAPEPRTRANLRLQLEELTAILAAYTEQIQYLGKYYGDQE